MGTGNATRTAGEHQCVFGGAETYQSPEGQVQHIPCGESGWLCDRCKNGQRWERHSELVDAIRDGFHNLGELLMRGNS